ncbi:hypothetical protein SNE40_020816 [Patella caerulea]|uniref:Uncharacterized protein n=1 Tax=Patella caerulea TaxID=87958 RepID=A0AAN8GH45_PATCE
MEDEQNPPEMMQEVGTLDPSTIEALQEGETITLSLEEASQLLLDGAEFAPGTYQILTTPDIIQNGEVPFEIINGDQETLLSFLPQNATTDGVHHATTEDGRQVSHFTHGLN